MALASKIDPGKAVNLALIIVGSIAGLAAVFFIYGKLKGAWTAALDKGKDLIDAGAVNPAKLSYTTAQYQGWANQLYDALDGIGSADVDLVISLFKRMNTYEDVMALQRAYGIRSVGNFSWDSRDRDLGQSLRWGLKSASNVEKVNAILASKNINFSF